MFDGLVESGLSVYGPWAVFFLLMLSGVGIPLGEDIITIPAGVLIAGGTLSFWPTLLAAYVGVVTADIMWFWICSKYGTPLLQKRWFKRMAHPRRLLQAKHQFEQRGIWIVVMSRFIPSSRTTMITAAGLLHMPLWKFASATLSCVLISAPLQIGLGYLIGKGIGTEDSGQMVLRILGLIVLLVALTAILSWWLQHRSNSDRAPRAKMRWLRRSRRGPAGSEPDTAQPANESAGPVQEPGATVAEATPDPSGSEVTAGDRP